MAANHSVFENLPLAPEDVIFGLQRSFNEDPHPQKVNLGIGGLLSLSFKCFHWVPDMGEGGPEGCKKDLNLRGKVKKDS